MHNPSLKEEPRDREPTVVPSQPSLSILDWLRQQGRLIELPPVDVLTPIAEEDIEDIEDLIGDDGYDDSMMTTFKFGSACPRHPEA
ncbi:MAG: DUF3134 family protein [Leptolyngbyaceae cyanobacterium SM1_4_3]|nr:DUF3134 family protein [Leptolyngbyaceae cyanobacterium SM1_4_3]